MKHNNTDTIRPDYIIRKTKLTYTYLNKYSHFKVRKDNNWINILVITDMSINDMDLTIRIPELITIYDKRNLMRTGCKPLKFKDNATCQYIVNIQNDKTIITKLPRRIDFTNLPSIPLHTCECFDITCDQPEHYTNTCNTCPYIIQYWNNQH